MAIAILNRFARPRSFFYLMTLRTGTELITLTLLINKLTGVYGVLALLTGYHLSPLQLSMYIYSIFALILALTLAPHIRRQSPLQCLALGWFFAIDSVINALYTAAFAVTWFLVLAQHTAPFGAGPGSHGPGGKMMDDTAGFTNPQYNVSRVDIVDGSPSGATSGVGLVGHEDNSAAAANDAAGGNVLGSIILQSGSISSLSVITALFAIRFYFVLVVMAYARGVLRQSIVSSSMAQGVAPPMASTDGSGARVAYLENPFASATGWKGRLGRMMVSFPTSYWLGPDGDHENGQGRWEREVGGRMQRKGQKLSLEDRD